MITSNVKLLYFSCADTFVSDAKIIFLWVLQAKNDTVVEVWINNHPDQELSKVTGMGYRALLAAPWYLDYISYGEDWPKYYLYEPSNFNGKVVCSEFFLSLSHCL